MTRMTDERLTEIWASTVAHIMDMKDRYGGIDALTADELSVFWAQQRIAELEAENERIVAESKQCHETNNDLCAEHIALRRRIKELERLAEIDREAKNHLNDCLMQQNKRIAELERYESLIKASPNELHVHVSEWMKALRRIEELETLNRRLTERLEGAQLRYTEDGKRIKELEARLNAVNNIKYETHPSWNCSDDFNSGWKACRELVRDVQE